MTARRKGPGHPVADPNDVPPGSPAIRRNPGGRLKYPRPRGVIYPSETRAARIARGTKAISADLPTAVVDALDRLVPRHYPTRVEALTAAIFGLEKKIDGKGT